MLAIPITSMMKLEEKCMRATFKSKGYDARLELGHAPIRLQDWEGG